jgi:uncharacterized protein involved in exopolysaccharide biosynthesis
MDLAELLRQLRARRWWIVVITVMLTIGFALVAFLSKPVYRVSAVLAPAAADRGGLGASGLGSALGQLGGIASLAGINVTASDAETEEALAVLRSRQFTETFIRDLDLMPRLFDRQWDAAAKQWKRPGARQPTPAKAFKLFDKGIRTIDRDRRTGLVTLQIDWRDRNEAASWANELIRRINEEMRQRAIKNADAYLQYLEKEYQTTPLVATREAVSRLMEAQIKQRMIASVSQEFAFRVVSAALPPDADDRIWPRKLLLLVAGPFVGLIVGVVLVLTYEALMPALAASKQAR